MNDLSIIEAEFGDLSRYQQCPDFWVAVPQHADRLFARLKQTQVHVIGHSAGGREILALEYGEKQATGATTDNLHSAMAAKVAPVDLSDLYPPAFFGQRRRPQPVLLLQGGIHGGELTGTVASLNLCHIIEYGVDLRGQEWPRLAELARQTRIAIIPWLNPDGVARWPLHNPTQCPAPLFSRCTQGVARDGTKYAYPAVKSIFPIPPEQTAYMGTYYNDAGVNLQYDFCSVQRQPETIAWMEYYLAERPDGALIFHCDGGSIISLLPYFAPKAYQLTLARLGGAVRNRLLAEGHPIGRISWAGVPNFARPYIDQINAAYLLCGCLPALVELPAGSSNAPYTCDQLLDIGLLTIEETLNFAHSEGLRPLESWEKVRSTLAAQT